MADFRKWLFAFAVVVVLMVASAPAHAQIFFNPNAFTCLANAGVPPIVRAEGITELVGDVVLTCTGGTPTPGPTALGVTTPIPLSNLTIFLNTNITSRLVGPASNGSEALVLIDEPYPAPGAQVPLVAPNPPAGSSPGLQTYCPVSAATGFLSSCVLTGTGGGIGAAGPYRGTGINTANVFQGQQVGANSVAWLGLPIDAPGTNAQRTIRITNVRANACQLGTSSTLIPTQIVMFISVNGSQQVTINNPQQTVGFIQPGLIVGNNTKTFLQCNTINNTLLGSSSNTNTAGPSTITATEGFASSFKARGYSSPGAIPTAPGTIGQATPTLQNVPGFPYNTESGFVSTPTGGAVTGATGVADYGTRIMVTFANIGAGAGIFVPTAIPLTLAGSCSSSGLSGCLASGGVAVLVTGTDANGNGGALTALPAAVPAPQLCTSSTGLCGADTAQVTLTGTSGVVVYEVVQANPNAIEALVLPISVAFISNTGQNLPGVGQATASVSFAPLSTVQTASNASVPIPRFCVGNPARNLFAINQCSCNLLFPFVTNQAGFDTGVAIANTTLDPYGTAVQAGTVSLFYYGNTTGGGAAPATQTSQTLTGGNELVFTLSNGGNLGIAATPGFQGYIIATTRFQFCHAFAFISDLGAQKLAEGYLAIQLDLPTLNRTGQNGENEGH